MEQTNSSPQKHLSFYIPIWRPFLLTLLSASILIGLGSWQLRRLEWKEGVIAHTKKTWHSPCLKSTELHTVLHKILRNQVKLPLVSERCYTVEGEFVFSTNLFLQSKTFPQKNKRIRQFLKEQNMTSYGVDVMTLFKTGKGEYIWINRGWAPLLSKVPHLTPQSSPRQKISFYLKIPPKPSLVLSIFPKNIPGSNTWYAPDLPQMSKFSQIPGAITGVYGVQISKKDGKDHPIKFPIPELEMRALPNNHLTYACIWYSLAACSLLIYGIYHRSYRLQERKHLP